MILAKRGGGLHFDRKSGKISLQLIEGQPTCDSQRTTGRLILRQYGFVVAIRNERGPSSLCHRVSYQEAHPRLRHARDASTDPDSSGSSLGSDEPSRSASFDCSNHMSVPMEWSALEKLSIPVAAFK
ncbi:hypothetical protein [Paraburkholderia strydomiana]